VVSQVLGPAKRAWAELLEERPWEALAAFVRTVKVVLRRYEQVNTDFALWTNRRPLEYMLKWAAVLAVRGSEAAVHAARRF
jgi:hypothetical protein